MFVGCLDHDKCYFPGAKKEEDCSTFVCTRDGTFKLSDPRKNDSKYTILCQRFQLSVSNNGWSLPIWMYI